jgi:outer membrane protein OmpA-like peptidoglycan-associated protein
MVYNLNDMANIFGLNNTRDIFKDIYNNFSQIHAKLYPEDYKTIANYTEIVDKSILRDALEKIKDNPNAGLLTGSALQTDYSKGTGEVVGDASYGIEFETGSAQISKASEQALLQLASKLNTSDGLSVNLYGHTDNTGNDSQNIPLSKERANSVAAFLKAQGIPEDRIKDVDGFGSTKPLHPNKDQNGAEARKENRRVQVVLKG